LCKNNWTTYDIGELNGKVVMVIGANTGLGEETAKQLAIKKCHRYLG
jgi:NAD(P)-dependent dehydrogenase (short-subunit alcohol dehydrogenase family)